MGTQATDTMAAAVAAPADQHDSVPAANGMTPAEIAAGYAKSWGLRLFAILAGVALWHWAVATHLDFYIRFDNVPSPLAVGTAFWRHLHETTFFIHILVSIERIITGYALAAGVGIFLGLIMGRSRIARDLLIPYIELLRPIPAVGWIPLAILMWPTEESSIIYITFLGAVFPIVINTVHGVEQTPELLVRAA
jgi:NitT/TauT family transport system permease protein